MATVPTTALKGCFGIQAVLELQCAGPSQGHCSQNGRLAGGLQIAQGRSGPWPCTDRLNGGVSDTWEWS